MQPSNDPTTMRCRRLYVCGVRSLFVMVCIMIGQSALAKTDDARVGYFKLVPQSEIDDRTVGKVEQPLVGNDKAVGLGSLLVA